MEDVGTVIAGTLKPEDLIPAFLEELRRQGYVDYVENVYRFDGDILEDPANHPDAMELVAGIMEELDSIAPEGYYFGAHPGDGSDFGFWPIEEED